MTRNGYYISGRTVGKIKIANALSLESYPTLMEKYCRLSSLTDNKKIVGGPASEVLRLGGSKSLVWVDIDTWDWDTIERWKASPTFPLVEGSYKCIPSATGKCHIYFVTERDLRNDECFGMLIYFLKSMKGFGVLPKALDRIYGPSFPLPIYLPKSKDNTLILPQQITEDLNAFTLIPTDLLRVPYRQWAAMKKCLTEYVHSAEFT